MARVKNQEVAAKGEFSKKAAPFKDDVRRYLDEIVQYPLLTAEEEFALGQKVRQGDVQARQDLINANLRFVISIAKRYARKSNLSLIDLVSVGNKGLILAADRFDPEIARFSTRAAFFIRREIRRHIEADNRYQKRYSQIDSEDGDLLERSAVIEDDPLAKILNACSEKACKDLMERSLKVRERQVLSMRLGLGVYEEIGIQEIAEILDISHQAVSQIYQRAYNKMHSAARGAHNSKSKNELTEVLEFEHCI